jgi:hypothetical protein
LVVITVEWVSTVITNRGGDMTTVGMNGMYEPDVAGAALDLDGATVESGPELGENDADPLADTDTVHRDSDGTPVGRADADADAAPN